MSDDEDGVDVELDRRTFLGGLGATAAASMVGCEDGGGSDGESDGSTETSTKRARTNGGADRPNILFVWSDDQSAPDLGCYGHDAIRSPHLDRLAEEGARFERAYVASPQCSPSRSAVMTGQPPHSTNTARLHAPLRDRFHSILEPLKEVGYFVGSYRKVHLGEEFMAHWDFDGSKSGPFNHHDRDGVTFEDFFDERPEDSPFFLHVGLTDPHRPYDEKAISDPHDPASAVVPDYLPDTEAVRSDLARYYDEITRMDGDCGRLLEILDKRGLAENTIVVFSADNGIPFPGGKGTLYEPGIRVPLIVRWPGNVEEGRVDKSLISLVDLPTTFLEVAGAEPMPYSQGESLVPLWTGESDSHRSRVYAERNWHDGLDMIRAVVSESHKLIQNYQFRQPYRPTLDIYESPSWESLRRLREEGSLEGRLEERYFGSSRPRVELYEVGEDGSEFDNLAGDDARADLVETLQEDLSDWMLETDDYLPPVQGAFGGLDLDVDPVTGPPLE